MSCGTWRSALRAAQVLTPFGGRDLEELGFRGFEDGREGRAVQALEGRGCDGVGRVDPGRAVVAVAFLQERREDRPVVPVRGVRDHGSPQTSSGRCPLAREVFRLSP